MKLSEIMKTYVEDKLYTPQRIKFGATQYKLLYLPEFFLFRDSYRRFPFDLMLEHHSENIYLSVHKNKIFRYSFQKSRYHRAPFIALAEDFLTDDWKIVECPIKNKLEAPDETPY